MNDDMLKPSPGRTVSNSRLTCAQCERMLLDAADGTLGPDDQAQFELHLAGCASCARAMADAQRGLGWLSMLHAVPPEPPEALMERILLQTSGDPAVAIPLRTRHEPLLAYGAGAAGGYAAGRMGAELGFPGEGAGVRGWLRRLGAGMVQPRFAMTAAMAFFSVALTMNLTGVRLSDLHASDLKPASVRHSFWQARSRMVRSYDNLRVVYELESRVRELQRQSDEQGTGGGEAPAPASPAKAPAAAGSGEAVPKQGPGRKPGGPRSSVRPEWRTRGGRVSEGRVSGGPVWTDEFGRQRWTAFAAGMREEGIRG